MFVVEGVRAVAQIIEMGELDVEAILIDKSSSESRDERVRFWHSLISNRKSGSRFEAVNVEILEIEPDDFRTLCDTNQSQGIIAVCRMPQMGDVDSIIGQESGLLIATDGIQDPGNLGTILRTASWFRCESLLLGNGTVDVFNPKVVRSTAGAIGSISLIDCNLDEILPLLKAAGWDIVLLDADSDAVDIRNYTFTKKTVIVAGNEGNGISKSLRERGFYRVFIPGNPDYVESLNASVAVSIALYAANVEKLFKN